jgi:hypothetical protein
LHLRESRTHISPFQAPIIGDAAYLLPVDGLMMLRAVVPDRLDRVAQPTDNGGSEEAVKDITSPTKPVVPLLNISAGGRVHEIQTFAHYVGTPVS